jgi:hypothetical protein
MKAAWSWAISVAHAFLWSFFLLIKMPCHWEERGR